MNTISNSQIEEHRARTPEVHQEPHAEFASHSEALFEQAQCLPSSTLVLRAGLGERGNAPVRAAAMQSAQRTYGNRAVQRCFHSMRTPSPGSNVALPAVQRFQGPDFSWLKNTGHSGAAGAMGMFGAIPLIGNVLNANMGGVQMLSSGVASAIGHDEAAKRLSHDAQNNFINAIPVYGNARSLGQGLHDTSAFYDNLFGGRSTPAEISSDIYHRDSGPILDRFLTSLF